MELPYLRKVLSEVKRESRQREGSKAATQFSRAEVIAKGPEVREDVAYVTAERARLALRRGK